MSLKKTKTKKLTENPSESIIIEHKVRNIIDLTKNKEICEEITRSSCWRPDIFLDLGCLECALKECCICPIKKLIRRDKPLRGHKRKK
jgi:hypothetical protein